MVRARPIKARYTKWHKQIAEWKQRAPLGYKVTDEVMNSMHMKDHLKGKEDQVILPQHAIATLFKESKGDALITTGVGQHQMWAAQYFDFQKPNRWMTSGGLGTMGYGLPAAMGVQIAHPKKLVVDIAGEASILMNIQEMSTIKQYRLPVKVFILNNNYRSMILSLRES